MVHYRDMMHLLPKIAITLFCAFLLFGAFWIFVIETFLTRNSEYPWAERLDGVKKVLTVIPSGSESLTGFRLLQGEGDSEKEVARFHDKWNTFLEWDIKHRFNYRDTPFHFIHRLSGVFEIYQEARLVGKIPTLGSWRFRKKIEGFPGSWRIEYPEKWGPDIDVFENEVRVAKITFEQYLHQKRRRKLCFFVNLEADTEVFVGMIATTCRPKFGNLVRRHGMQ